MSEPAAGPEPEPIAADAPSPRLLRSSEPAPLPHLAEGDATDPLEIRVSAVLAVDDEGRLLVVRKRATSVFMQPGGKPEPGETPAETLARELHEELDVRIDPAELEPLGVFTAPAANESGMTVVADVFRAVIDQPVRAAGEIDEVRWMLRSELATAPVAPLITQHMLALMPPVRGER